MIKNALKKAVDWLLDFFLKHKRETIKGAAGIGFFGFIFGCFNVHKAKKINKSAQAIWQDALDRHDQEYEIVQQVLSELGEAEIKVIDSFPYFADLIERIQGRPKIKSKFRARIKLPNYEPEQFKCLSENVQMAIVGIGGTTAGAIAGLAAFGVGVLITAPAMVGAGFVLCVKGFALKKKAIKNKHQAEKVAKSVDEIVLFYRELSKVARTNKEIIETAFSRYLDYLNQIDKILTVKTVWNQLTQSEKQVFENTVLLAKLLYAMTTTNIIVKQENPEKLETINTVEIMKIQESANKILKETA